MHVDPVTHSSFPKNNDSLALKKALDNQEKGRIGDHELKAVFSETQRLILNAQLHSRMSRVTDGMLGWVDEVNPLLSGVKGVVPGDMQRYFNTNVLYRKPIIQETPTELAPQLSYEVEDLRRGVKDQFKRKVCITGPYSLSKMCVDETDGAPLSLAFADLIAAQISEFEWPCFIQINEPAIVFNPKDEALFSAALRRFIKQLRWSAEKLRYRICLSIHYGAISDYLWSELRDMNWKGYLGLDLVEGAGNIEQLEKHSWKGPLQLGVVDAKSTKMESESDVCELLERVHSISTISPNDVLLTTSCGLEFLPWTEACKKLDIVSLASELWNINSRRMA